MWWFWSDNHGWWFPLTGLMTVASLVLAIIAIVDMTRHSEAEFRRAGSNRTTWLVLVAVSSAVFHLVGVVLSIVYLASIKPKVDAAARDRGRPLPPPVVPR